MNWVNKRVIVSISAFYPLIILSCRQHFVSSQATSQWFTAKPNLKTNWSGSICSGMILGVVIDCDYADQASLTELLSGFVLYTMTGQYMPG